MNRYKYNNGYIKPFIYLSGMEFRSRGVYTNWPPRIFLFWKCDPLYRDGDEWVYAESMHSEVARNISERMLESIYEPV